MKKYLSTALAVLLVIAVAPALAGDKADEQKVVEDLKAAFTNETVASAKYAAYAEKAKAEGLQKVAVLFKAASTAKEVVAANHKAGLEQLGEPAPQVRPEFKVNSTKENLEDAIKDEADGSAAVYPEFIEDASEAKVAIANISFNYAYKSQLKSKAFYEHALNVLENGGVESLPSMYRVCGTCGNIYPGEGPARCGCCLTCKDRLTTIK